MLQYHPVHDPQHTAFRNVRLLLAQPKHAFDVVALRILDVFLLFPVHLAGIRMRKEWSGYRKVFRSRGNKYFSTGSVQSASLQMQGIQTLAFTLLLSKGIIRQDCFRENQVVLVLKELPRRIRKLAERRNAEDTELVDFLVNKAGALPVLGPEGLKARTRLADYRYDAI